MRIAIAINEKNDLDSTVSHHFGRCPYYLLVDVENRKVGEMTIVENPYFQTHTPGQVPEFVNNLGVNVMLSGGRGQRAIQFFEQFGIEVATGALGTAGQTLERYLRGELSIAEPCRDSVEHGHHHN